jgi:hypothetical protein
MSASVEPEVTGYVVTVVVGATVPRIELVNGAAGLAETEDAREHAAMRSAVKTTTMTDALRRIDQNVLGIAFEDREEPAVESPRQMD